MSMEAKKSIVDKTYEKEVMCPVCDNKISVRVVKSKYIRIKSRDSDFMIRYNGPNPLLYDVWLCTKCGYAAQSSKFEAISDAQVKVIKEQITKKWNYTREYPFPYTVDTAIELHQLALLTSMVKKDKDSEKAHLCLKTAWLYRIKGDQENENKFLTRSLDQFLKAYEYERLPVAGLNEPSLMYLIGELYRRLDDNASALKWFSNVIVSRDVSPRIKDMAREQKDVIRGMSN